MLGGFTDPLGVRGLGVGAESPPLQSSKNIRDKSETSKKTKYSKQSNTNNKHKSGKEVFCLFLKHLCDFHLIIIFNCIFIVFN